jgi:tripartite-type tricarboxylate transporter receptor subunit TctC
VPVEFNQGESAVPVVISWLRPVTSSIAAALLSVVYLPAAAAAENEYPSKSVRLIVPLAPGGGNDILSRYIAHKLGETTGQRIVVDNRPGAGGNIGTELAAKAPPDGYTLLMGGSAQITTNPSLYKNLPYDVMKDLAPITLIAEFPLLVLVHPSLPVHSMKDLIAFAKSRPGKISYGSSASGGGTHLTVELIKTMTGIDMVHVPYKGAGPALADLVAGQISLLLNNPLSSLPYAKSGRIRPIAITSIKRLAAMPDIPTVDESGIPGFSATNWLGLFAPARTPPAIVMKIHDDVTKIIRQKDTVEWITGQGMEPVGSSPDQFLERIKADTAIWSKVIKDSGARID